MGFVMAMPKTGKSAMNPNPCWYCNKDLAEPLTTYRRTHRKKKYRIDVTVHSDCYKSFNRTRKQYKPMASGSITQ
jgi:hypothetical protein